MSQRDDPIATLVQSTSLPPEVWTMKGFDSIPQLEGIDYTKGKIQDYLDPPRLDMNNGRWSPISKRLTAALEQVSSSHVLGASVLVRLPQKVTVMVSLAELAYVSFDKPYRQLLFILLQALEASMRSSDSGRKVCPYSWKEEISRQEHRDLQRPSKLHQSRSLFDSGLRFRKAPGSEPASQALDDLRLQQATLEDKLDVIQEQNEQILQLLERNQNLELFSLEKEPKYYKEYFSSINVCREDDQSFLGYSSPLRDMSVFQFLLDWLTVSLGGIRMFTNTFDLQSIDIGIENKISNLESNQMSSCWRGKIHGGRIFNMSASACAGGLPASVDIPKGSLQLTAAALWALFDNMLQRMPGCSCTFKTNTNEFLQCRSLRGKWFVWHYFKAEATCDGKHCHENVSIALPSDSDGHKLHTNSPCILGWTARTRDQADRDIWDILPVSKDFKAQVATNYRLKDFQILAQLSVPLGVNPQFGGTITFPRDNYVVHNSSEKECETTLIEAATRVVLIYDERRGIHLAIDGADLIEMRCFQRLRHLGCSTVTIPLFSHSRALGRLKEWSRTNFTSDDTGLHITGDTLVRQVASDILELMQATKTARCDQKLIYWALEDFLLRLPT